MGFMGAPSFEEAAAIEAEKHHQQQKAEKQFEEAKEHVKKDQQHEYNKSQGMI